MVVMISVTLFAFMLVVLLMAIGVLFGRKPISGSCGGLAQVGIGGECKICGRKDPENCSGESSEAYKPSSTGDVNQDFSLARNVGPNSAGSNGAGR